MLPPHLERLQRKDERRLAILNQGIPPNADDWTLRQIAEKRRRSRRNRLQGKLQSDLERLYKTFSTRHLLSRLDALRSYDYDYSEWASEQPEYSIIAEEYALRKILATRPHLKRKHDRQKIAKRQRGMSKSKNR